MESLEFDVNQILGNRTEESPNKKINREASHLLRQADFNPSQCQGPGQGQESGVKQVSMDDLPPEMLMEILKWVETPSLFNCRLVSRQLSAISSSVLCSRPKTKIWFLFIKTKFMRSGGRWRERGKKNLRDFLICMKKSKNCSYAHFAFTIRDDSAPQTFFDHPHLTALLSYFSAPNSNSNQNQSQRQNQNQTRRIKSLELSFELVKDLEALKIVAEKLGDLLVNKTPGLEKFSFTFNCPFSTPQVKLFSGATQNHPEIAPVPLEPQFQLPHLKVLCFESRNILHCSGIIQDLLSAAVNLKKIYWHTKESSLAFESFQFLQSTGKLQLLKNFEFASSEEFRSCVRERRVCEFNFTRALFSLQLEELDLGIFSSPHLNRYNDVNTHIKDTQFLSDLLESTKDSLKTLQMSPLGHFFGLQLPRFKNLTELKLENSQNTSNKVFFPPGTLSLDVFPAVRDLDLPKSWVFSFPHFEYIPVLPSVKNLRVNDTGLTITGVSVLDWMCPNLKQLCIHKDSSFLTPPQTNFLSIGRQIWRLMKQLESLEVDIDIKMPENGLSALDACFTGIPLENCKRLCNLRAQIEARIVWKTQGYSERGWPEQELEWDSEVRELTIQKEHPSILDKKYLKRLSLNWYEGTYKKMGCEKYLRLFNMAPKPKFSWISQEYAFDLMPDLKVTQG